MTEGYARIFHDLRNALGAVLLNLEVASDAKAEPDLAREAASDALREARRLEGMIEKVRAKIDADRPKNE